MAEQRNYPIGMQTFEKIREENCIYIDKTEYVYRLAHNKSNYVFLSRPRRKWTCRQILVKRCSSSLACRKKFKFRSWCLERWQSIYGSVMDWGKTQQSNISLWI